MVSAEKWNWVIVAEKKQKIVDGTISGRNYGYKVWGVTLHNIADYAFSKSVIIIINYNWYRRFIIFIINRNLRNN